MRTIAKMLVAAIVAMFMALVLVEHGVSNNVVVVVFFCTGILVSVVVGVFDAKRDTRYRSIHNKRANYKRAA